jgi:probable rRNA maturation factor
MSSRSMPAVVSRRAPRSPALEARRVRVMAQRMLLHLGLESAELSVLLTDDASIRELNREYRGKDGPTDVLAFPLDTTDDERPRTPTPLLLGDVVVSLDTAARQARARRRSLLDEVAWLLAHGLLHLVGYDHPTARAARAMDSVTKTLVGVALDAQPRRGGAQIGRGARR